MSLYIKPNTGTILSACVSSGLCSQSFSLRHHMYKICLNTIRLLNHWALKNPKHQYKSFYFNTHNKSTKQTYRFVLKSSATPRLKRKIELLRCRNHFLRSFLQWKWCKSKPILHPWTSPWIYGSYGECCCEKWEIKAGRGPPMSLTSPVSYSHTGQSVLDHHKTVCFWN